MKQFWAEEAPWKACALVEAAYEEVMTILTRITYSKLSSGLIDSQEIESRGPGIVFFVGDIFDRATHLLEAYDCSSGESRTHAGTDSSLLIRAIAIRALHTAAFS